MTYEKDEALHDIVNEALSQAYSSGHDAGLAFVSDTAYKNGYRIGYEQGVAATHSTTMTFAKATRIWALHKTELLNQQEIANIVNVNSGRVNEVINGKSFPEVREE